MFLFFIIATIGLIMSCSVHLATFFVAFSENVNNYAVLLHLGIFIVWIPTCIVHTRNKNSGESKAPLFKITPQTKTFLALFFLYVVFNFFFTIEVLNQGANAGIINGKKVLHSKSTIIKELTDDEYKLHQTYETRSMSGHWMAFYGIAAYTLGSHCNEKKYISRNSAC
jgi:hypothetical protein